MNPKTLPDLREEIDRHRGILVRREYAAIVGEFKMKPFIFSIADVE